MSRRGSRRLLLVVLFVALVVVAVGLLWRRRRPAPVPQAGPAIAPVFPPSVPGPDLLRPGLPVYDSGGEEIGVVHRIGETFFHVLGGAFADQDYHIPFDFVERVTAEGVYLRVSHGVLRQGSTPWEHPPGTHR